MDMQDSLALALNVERVDKHDKYLGLPMDISHSKIDAFGFLKERIDKKIQSWRGKNLSSAGKEVLIKAAIQSIPTYIMSCFEIPKQLCHEMQQSMARFWWGSKGDGKKIHWLAWDKLCESKGEGGMGFRKLSLFNLSLLAKQGWRLLRNPNSLVAQLFKSRYFPNCNFLDAVAQPGMSFTWRSILAGRKILHKGIRYQIGMGDNVSLWNDPWLPLPHSFKPFSAPMEGTESWMVSDIIDNANGEWVSSVIDELFTKEEANIILKIPLSLRSSEDRLIWHYDTKGVYSVKSGYHVARIAENLGNHASSSRSVRAKLWNIIWRLRIPPKVRSFVWRLLRGIIPTKAALAKKFPLPDMVCVFCHDKVENDMHLFKLCGALEYFWQASGFDFSQNYHRGHTLTDWFSKVSSLLLRKHIELLCMCWWVIWKERNNIVWEDGTFHPLHMASWASLKLEEYQKFHHPRAKKHIRLPSHWENPPSGYMKINICGVFRVNQEQGGIGVAVRNDLGLCIAALSRHLEHASSVIHVVAEACRAGILMAIHHRWDNLILETDCAMIVTALTSTDEDLSQFSRVLEDCRVYLRSFNSFIIRHIYRKANGVAQRLAHVASFSSFDKFWLEDTPSIIEEVLYEDGCCFTRGLGITSPSVYTWPRLAN